MGDAYVVAKRGGAYELKIQETDLLRDFFHFEAGAIFTAEFIDVSLAKRYNLSHGAPLELSFGEGAPPSFVTKEGMTIPLAEIAGACTLIHAHDAHGWAMK